ncbi:MAG: PaaI family thioesterase [Streptomyces sp.]
MSAHPTSQHRDCAWQDPRPTAEAIGRLSGPEVSREIGEGTLPTPSAMDTLAVEPVEVEPGGTVFERTPAGWHGNALGTVHGGVVAPPADNAMGAAVHSRLPAGTGYTTQGLAIAFLRPVTADTGRSAEKAPLSTSAAVPPTPPPRSRSLAAGCSPTPPPAARSSRPTADSPRAPVSTPSRALDLPPDLRSTSDPAANAPDSTSNPSSVHG